MQSKKFKQKNDSRDAENEEFYCIICIKPYSNSVEEGYNVKNINFGPTKDVFKILPTYIIHMKYVPYKFK